MSELRSNKGFHPILENDHGFTFVDGCMQAWPDADWEDLNRHGVTAYGVTSWMPGADVTKALEDLMYWHLIAGQHGDIITVKTTEDIRRAKREGLAALLLASQDGSFIDGELHRIEAFYRLGLRTMIPAYNFNNQICGGCLDRTDSGITAFGERVIEECNRLGLVLDCSHLGERSSIEIMEASEDPVIFSHSNVRDIVDHPRNITDNQIKVCAQSNGVIGLAPFGAFTLPEGKTEWPNLDDFMEHINHVVELTGSTNHVGIGTDMSLGSYPPHKPNPWGEPAAAGHTARYNEHVTGRVRSPKRSLKDFNSYPQITNLIEALEANGYSERDIEKILGGNLLRVFDEVWKPI